MHETHCYRLKNLHKLFLALTFLFITVVSFAQAPTISSFSPAYAYKGSTVTITGTNFSSATAVKFGGTAAASFVVVNATTITAVVGYGTSGSVSVTNPSGTGSRTGFTYEPLTRIMTDFGGFWNSAVTSVSGTVPNNSHHLLAFEFNGITYSTGVNNTVLNQNGVSYTAGNYRALPIAGLTGTVSGTAVNLAFASVIDGNPIAANANAPALKGKTIVDVLTDGIRGLDLGTGVTNLPTSAVLSFSITSMDPAKFSDDEPDIIVTQIAQPTTGDIDTYSFVNSSGTLVGNTVTSVQNNLRSFGTYKLDLFKLIVNQQLTTAKTDGTLFEAAGGTRDIRIAAYRLSDFGINASNYSSIAAFKINPSGTSDQAFIAYNANAMNFRPSIVHNLTNSATAICSGSNAVMEVNCAAANEGALTYSWEVSTDGGSSWSAVTDGAGYSGATTNRLVAVSPALNTKFRATVTESGGHSNTSSAFTITSSSAGSPTVTAPTGFTVCANSSSTMTQSTVLLARASGGTGTYTYQWQESSTSSSGPFTSITGATDFDYYPSLSAAGTKYYRVVVSNVGCTGSVNSTAATVTVTAGPTITASNVSRCGTGTATLTATPSAGSIAWYNAAGSNIGSTSTITSPSVSSTTTFYAVATTTTPACSSPSYPVTVTVDAASVGGNIAATATDSLCYANNTKTLTLSGHTGNISKWQYSVNDGSSWTDIANTSTSYTAENITSKTLYRAVVTNGSCAAANSSNAELRVKTCPPNLPPPAGPPPVSGLISAGNYEYYKRDDAEQLAANAVSGAELRWYTTPTGGSYTTTAPTPSTLTVGTYTYYVSQFVNGQESERVEVKVKVKPITWHGGGGTEWKTNNSWRGNRVPESGDEVVIEDNPVTPPKLDQNRIIGKLTFGSGDSSLVRMNGKKLVIQDSIIGTSRFEGDEAAEIEITGAANNTLIFENSGRKLRHFTVNNPGANIKLGSNLDIYGVITITDGSFDLNGDTVTLKAGTYPYVAQVGPSAGTLNQNSGKWMIERSIPPRRANRLLSASVNTEQSIWHNWQEGANNTSTVYTNNQNPNPGYGTHITGTKSSSVAATNGLDITQTGNSSLWTYNVVTSAWVPVTNTKTTKLQAGKAYRMIVRGDRSINMNTNNPTPTSTILRSVGKIVKGDTTITLHNVANAWNLVGNPYPCAVNLKSIVKTNAAGVIYIFDPNMYDAADTVWTPYLGYSTGNYVSYVLSNDTKSNDTSEVNYYLQPGQAFYIQTLADGAASLSFSETDKYVEGFTQTFKTASGNYQKLYASLYSDTATALSLDGLAVVFDDAYSNDYVLGEDAAKFSSSFESISVQLGNTKASISSMKLPTVADSIQLSISGFSSITKYAFKFRPENLQGILPYLHDRYTGTYTDIDPYNVSKISFTINKQIPASIAANRFVIRFKPASTLPVDMLEVKATKKENGALISWKVANEEKIQHYEVEESADAKDFLLMAKVAANNSQQSVKVYEAFDKALFTGNNYYRIKSVAADGNFRYSPVVKLLHHTITNPSVSVYPNPVKDNKISLALNNLPEGNYNIVIADQKGAVLYSRQLKLNTSNSVEIITVPGSVKAGSYILSVTGENVKETRQIIFE